MVYLVFYYFFQLNIYISPKTSHPRMVKTTYAHLIQRRVGGKSKAESPIRHFMFYYLVMSLLIFTNECCVFFLNKPSLALNVHL